MTAIVIILILLLVCAALILAHNFGYDKGYHDGYEDGDYDGYECGLKDSYKHISEICDEIIENHFREVTKNNGNQTIKK